MYDVLSNIEHQDGTAIAVRPFGAEKEYGINIDWTTVMPYINMQNYGFEFAPGRWSPDDEWIEYNYSLGTARIWQPDWPYYILYQIDLIADLQKDKNYLLEYVLQTLGYEGYLEVQTYGKTIDCSYIQSDSMSDWSPDVDNLWRHTLRYRVDVRLKNLNYREAYLVLQRIIRRYDISGENLKKTITLTGN
jgi:hypothetical protein